MFSVQQKREIADAVQRILRNTNHPELPVSEIQFCLHVDGAESWSWADIRNNGAVVNPSVNSWNERQATALPLPQGGGGVMIELPQGWYMLSEIEPEPGSLCDWSIMAPWGCDHGQGEWRIVDGEPAPELFDLPDGAWVKVQGFANKDGLMVSDPKLTAWRYVPLPTTKPQP